MTDGPGPADSGENIANGGLLPLLAERVSPAWFDGADCVDDTTVDVLLEAARRSPSAGNSQPWAFIVGRRGDSVHRRLCRHLAAGSARWAPQAGLLLANLTQVLVEDADFEYSEFARYDLGQAVAHMTIQAQALGLGVHQFRGFNRAGVTTEFGVPRHWEVTSMAAVGQASRSNNLGGGSSSPSRHSAGKITWARQREQPRLHSQSCPDHCPVPV